MYSECPAGCINLEGIFKVHSLQSGNNHVSIRQTSFFWLVFFLVLYSMLAAVPLGQRYSVKCSCEDRKSILCSSLSTINSSILQANFIQKNGLASQRIHLMPKILLDGNLFWKANYSIYLQYPFNNRGLRSCIRCEATKRQHRP